MLLMLRASLPHPGGPERTAMIHALKGLFLAILAFMLFATVSASFDRSVWRAGATLWPDPWFRATLADAYCGFLTFYTWLFYREASWPRRPLLRPRA